MSNVFKATKLHRSGNVLSNLKISHVMFEDDRGKRMLKLFCER